MYVCICRICEHRTLIFSMSLCLRFCRLMFYTCNWFRCFICTDAWVLTSIFPTNISNQYCWNKQLKLCGIFPYFPLTAHSAYHSAPEYHIASHGIDLCFSHIYTVHLEPGILNYERYLRWICIRREPNTNTHTTQLNPAKLPAIIKLWIILCVACDWELLDWIKKHHYKHSNEETFWRTFFSQLLVLLIWLKDI